MGYPPYCTCLPPKRKKECASSSIYDSMIYGELSSVSAVQNKDSVVRIVLASGMVELYETAVSAHSVMQRYPGLCLARPEVFSMPHESLVGPKEMLLPGQKFYLVPKTTIDKLQLRQPKKLPEEFDEAMVKRVVPDKEEEGGVCSAKDFYASNEKWARCFMRKFMNGSLGAPEQKKPFNPPINKTRRRKGVLDGWKPALTPVDEVSP